MLRPLVKNFRKEVIRVRISGDQTELSKHIGVENFEGLVDAVNMIDFLENKHDLSELIKASSYDEFVIRYKHRLIEVNQIYHTIHSKHNDMNDMLPDVDVNLPYKKL